MSNKFNEWTQVWLHLSKKYEKINMWVDYQNSLNQNRYSSIISNAVSNKHTMIKVNSFIQNCLPFYVSAINSTTYSWHVSHEFLWRFSSYVVLSLSANEDDLCIVERSVDVIFSPSDIKKLKVTNVAFSFALIFIFLYD